MFPTFSDDITITSLILSFVCIGLVIYLMRVVSRDRQERSAVDKSIDVEAIVQEFGERTKRLEQRLIDQKVKTEILELRLSKGNPMDRHEEQAERFGNSGNYTVPRQLMNLQSLSAQPRMEEEVSRRARSSSSFGASGRGERDMETRPVEETPKSFETSGPDSLDRSSPSTGRGSNVGSVSPSSKRDSINTDILRIVVEEQGKATARDVQRRIGRSREHIARTMNLLYKQGLVARTNMTDNTGPYAYQITEAGKRALSLSAEDKTSILE